MAYPDYAEPVAQDPDVRYWLNQIEAASKWHMQWHEDGKKVIERFLDQWTDAPLAKNRGHRMNMLWSNVETLTPALYAHTAKPAVQRRFRDRDPVGRWASTVLERVESYELDTYEDDYNYRMAINDYLLPGRGQVWVYYEPTISKGEGGSEQIEWECCRARHINWKDFITNPARSWDEVWWVGKREYLTKDEAEAQGLDVSELTFSEQDQIGTGNPDSEGAQTSDRVKKAAVWEIWSKTHGKVYFVSKNCPKPLREPAPPGLKFQAFFPCPRPLTATTAGESILPRPDYILYEDQAKEIDRMTQRINLLTKALRVAGVYDSSQESLSRLLENTDQNHLIPCDTYAVLAANGGIEGSVTFFPMTEIIQALKQCYESREIAKQAMYEVTGISDIVRGASQASETATAQQLKSQWGGLRIRDRQQEVQRFIRDVFRLKAEVHAEQFQAETLKAMSNVPLADAQTKQMLQRRVQAQQMAQQNPQIAQMAQQAMAANHQLQALAKPLTDQEKLMLKEPTWEEVVALLRNDKLRGFSIDVETDSTIATDEMAEKQNRSEFVTAITSFMEQWGPMVAQKPQLADFAGELLSFATRAFPAADSLQTAIEEMVDSIKNAPQQPSQPDLKGQAAMMDAKTKQAAQQSEAQNERLKIETDARTDIQTHAMTLRADAIKGQMDRQAGAEQADEDRRFEAERGEQESDGEEKREQQAIQQLAGAVNTLASQQAQMMQQLNKLMQPSGAA